MHRIVSPAEFESDAFAAHWRALLERCTHYDEGQTEWWNRCWWRHYGNVPGKELFVIVEEGDGQVRSIWPLFLRKRFGLRVLSWIGQADGMITDCTMPLLPDHHREQGSGAFLEFLTGHASRWDVADLSLPGWCGLLPYLEKSAADLGASRNLSCNTRIIEHSTSMALAPSFDAYLASLGSKVRKHMRQYLRAAEKQGATFEIARGRDCTARLPELIRLNRKRWAVFEDSRARDFLANYIADLPVGNESVFMACLRIEERIVASVLGFEHNDVCYVHSAGIDRDVPGKLNAGTTMWLLLVKALIEAGCSRLEHGPGAEAYKLQLGASVTSVHGMTLWRNSSTMYRWRLGQALAAVRRRILNSLRR